MTAKFLITVAARAVFATGSVLARAAFAQSATQPATTTTPTTAAPATSSATATPTESYLTQQAPDQVSANTYLGQSGYSTTNN